MYIELDLLGGQIDFGQDLSDIVGGDEAPAPTQLDEPVDLLDVDIQPSGAGGNSAPVTVSLPAARPTEPLGRRSLAHVIDERDEVPPHSVRVYSTRGGTSAIALAGDDARLFERLQPLRESLWADAGRTLKRTETIDASKDPEDEESPFAGDDVRRLEDGAGIPRRSWVPLLDLPGMSDVFRHPRTIASPMQTFRKR